MKRRTFLKKALLGTVAIATGMKFIPEVVEARTEKQRLLDEIVKCGKEIDKMPNRNIIINDGFEMWYPSGGYNRGILTDKTGTIIDRWKIK